MKKQFFLFKPASVFNACKKAFKKTNAKIIQINERSLHIQAVICHGFLSDKLILDVRVVGGSPESCSVEINSTVVRKGLLKSRKAIQWELEYLDMLFMVITGNPSYYQAFDKSESFLQYVELSRKSKEPTFENRGVVWHVRY